MRQPRSAWNTSNALVVCFVALLMASLLYLPNMGGVGLGLPFNTLVYTLLGALMLPILWRPLRRRGWLVTPGAVCFTLGVALLALPLAFASEAGSDVAAWRVAGLLAGWGIYCCWLQLRLNFRWRHAWVGWLLLLISGQAVLALLQLFWPAWSWVPQRGPRAYGIFQQPNVLGSLLATGLALVFMLMLLPGYALASVGGERGRQTALAALLVLLAALLVWVQSRTGWLAGGLLLMGYWLLFGRRLTRRLMMTSGLMLFGCGLGIAVLLGASGDGAPLSHALSNQARLSMLQDTLKMIAIHPLTGWGYGSFEVAFQHFRIGQQPPTPVLEITRHPHNEVLLWWVEGGVTALLGMVAIACGAGRVLWQAWHHDRRAFAAGRRSAGEASALCLAMLPIVLHCQLEYPFYVSALHWLVFALMLATLDRLCCRQACVVGRNHHGLTALRAGVGLLCLCGMAMMLVMLRGGMALTHVERSGLRDMRPLLTMSPLAAWGFEQRRSFDLQTFQLLAYNRTHDETLLDGYAAWARDYLRLRIDANVYANLIAILRHRQQWAEAERYRNSAALLFPADRRFFPA